MNFFWLRLWFVGMWVALATGQCFALSPDIKFHQYQHQVYNLEDGIPQSSIFDIEQDQQGYIWLATHGGLVRFDGQQFLVFGDDENELLPSSMLSHLMMDSQQRLWVVSDKGLGFWANGNFTRYPYDYSKNGHINAIIELNDGSILVGANGLYRLRAKGVELFYHEKFVVTSLAKQGDSIWVGSLGNLSKLHTIKKSMQFFSLKDKHNRVNQLIVDGEDVWVGTRKGMYLVSDGKLSLQFAGYDGGDPEVTGMYIDREHTLWVATRETLVRIHDSGKVEHIHKESPHAFPWAISFFEDKEGNMWIGSRTEGIVKIWNGWGHKVAEYDGLPTNFLWSITENSGRLWFGSNLGLASYDGKKFKQHVSAEQLHNSEVYTILAEGERIWLGTLQGVALYQQGKLTYPEFFDDLQYTQINALARDAEGHLWVGSKAGLWRYGDGSLKHYGLNSGLTTKDVRFIHQTKAGSIFVGTADGLYQLLDERLVLVGPRILNSAFVTTMMETQEGVLVVGTYRRGLFLYDGTRWFNFTRSKGLFSNSSFALFELDGYLWLSSHNGVSRIAKQALNSALAGTSETLESEPILSVTNKVVGAQQVRCCNGAGTAKGAVFNGTIWLPSLLGAVTVKPDNVVENTVPPNVIVEWLETPKRRINNVSNSFELDQDERNFIIKYNGLSYQSPKDVGFQYRLLGLHDSWSPIKADREVSFNNLGHGEYVFEVRARNNHGVWSQSTARAVIQITPMFHETVGYKVLLAVVALLALTFGFLLLQLRHRRQEQKLQQLVDNRTHELTKANEKLYQQNELLQKISQTDSLTQLKNRHFLEEQIEHDIPYFERHVAHADGERVMAFILLDIDYFKSINDSYGHKAGDQILQQFAKLLQEFTRDEDYAVRMGGEEFLIVARDVGENELSLMVDRLKSIIKKHLFKVGNTPINITASIGYATYPIKLSVTNEPVWSVLLQLADYALYEAKNSGRDAYAAIQFNQRQHKTFSGVYDLRHELKRMHESGQLQIKGSW